MGNSRHLWFLIALLEIFVICSAFKRYTEILHPVITCFILLFINYISLPFHLNNTLQYLFYFYLGFLYNKIYDKIILFINHQVSIFIFAFLQIYLHQYEGWIFNHIKAISGCLTFFGLTSMITTYIVQKNILLYWIGMDLLFTLCILWYQSLASLF